MFSSLRPEFCDNSTGDEVKSVYNKTLPGVRTTSSKIVRLYQSPPGYKPLFLSSSSPERNVPFALVVTILSLLCLEIQVNYQLTGMLACSSTKHGLSLVYLYVVEEIVELIQIFLYSSFYI